MSSPVAKPSKVSLKATSTPQRPSQTDQIVQTSITAPAQHSSREAYRAQGRGIRVIQQYVNSILKEHSCSKPLMPEEDIYDYDLIGAVGLKESGSGRATIWYHVKWKGFGVSAMTWEPELHFFGPDLEALWTEHGRVNRAGEITWTFGQHDKQLHPYASDKGGTEGNEMSETHQNEVEVIPRDSLCGISSLLDEKEVGLECNFSDHSTVQEHSASTVSTELISCQATAEGRPEAHTCNLCEHCLSANDQTSTCASMRLGIEGPSSGTSSFLQAESQRGARTSFENLHQRDLATSLLPSVSNGMSSPDRPSPITDSYSARSEVPVVCAPLIVHHNETSQKTSKRRRRFCRRTKSGCLSCRRRKKKCDEQWPSCESFQHHSLCVRLHSPDEPS